MSLARGQQNYELVKAVPQELQDLIVALTLLIETINKDARNIEKTLPRGYVREKLILRDVRAELSRLKLAANEAMETLPRISLKGSRDSVFNLSALPEQVTEALEYCVLTLSPTAEKLARLTELRDASNSDWNPIEMELAEHSRRIDRARSFLKEILSSLSKGSSSAEPLAPIAQLDEPISVYEPVHGLVTQATGFVEHSEEGESKLARMRQRLRRHFDEELPKDNQSPILLPYDSLDNFSPQAQSVNSFNSSKTLFQSPKKPTTILTCWILIFLVLTVALGSTALGVYFSVAKNKMGDGFTTAAWVVAVGTLLLIGPIAYHYPHCKCWKRRGNHIKSCWVLIICGLGFLLTSGTVGLTFTVAKDRMGDGFSAAGWIIAVGTLVLAGPAAYHFPHCRCWEKRESFRAPFRASTIDFLRS